MFLIPKTADSPTLPANIAGEGGEARISYADDQPVLGASGSARFTVRRRRRLPFAGPRTETVVGEAAHVFGRRLRAGDEVDLEIGGRTMSWRYSPNANLGRASRVAMTAVKVATVVAGIGVLDRVVNELAYNAEMSRLSALPGTRPVSDVIRLQASQLYPAADHGPSDFMRGLIRVRKEGGDLQAFGERWSSEHPQARQVNEEVRP